MSLWFAVRPSTTTVSGPQYAGYSGGMMDSMQGMKFHSCEAEVERLEREQARLLDEVDTLRRQLAHMTTWRDSAIIDGNAARAEAAELRRRLAEAEARLAQPAAARTADAEDYPPTA